MCCQLDEIVELLQRRDNTETDDVQLLQRRDESESEDMDLLERRGGWKTSDDDNDDGSRDVRAALRGQSQYVRGRRVLNSFSSAQEQEIVNVHNKLRRQEGASNMETLVGCAGYLLGTCKR